MLNAEQLLKQTNPITIGELVQRNTPLALCPVGTWIARGSMRSPDYIK